MSKIILSGVTPSGSGLHIGNYFGMLKPLVELGQKNQVYCFVSDLHALTTVQDPKTLSANIRNVISSYLACGVDAENFIFFRQSQVPQHCEMSTILSNFVGLGQMKRMHAYKDKLGKGADAANINMGLFNYPILMAADILVYNADAVPVGADQKQHLEIARDIAQSFNKTVKKEVFKLPEPLIDGDVGKIVGTDGQRKMSKSLQNVIGIFDDYDVIEKQIMNCFTDSQRKHAADPGTVEGNPVFVYHDLWNENKEEVADLKRRYREGKVGDVEVKQALLRAHRRYFAPLREKKAFYDAHPEEVEKILARGRALASLKASQVLQTAKKALGLEVNFASKPLETDPFYSRPLIDFEQFMKVEMRVGKVLQASLPDWSDKLIEQKVDFGPKIGQKTIYSALRAHFTPEDFVGKQFVYATNLLPRKMGPGVSEGMIIAVESGNGVERWQVSDQVETGMVIG